MTRTVEEYVALAAGLHLARVKGCRVADAAWHDLRQEGLEDGVWLDVVHRMVSLILRRGAGPTHVHVSPREESP